MPLSARALLLLQLLTVASPALAHGPPDVDRAARAITRALPGGWSIVEENDQEIPYGHHSCDNYAGPRGMKLVVLGVKDVNLHLQDHDGNWYTRPAARESVELWLMPSGYRDSRWSWLCHHRPIQPARVSSVGLLRVFGQPSHRLNSEAEFRALISTASAFGFPEAVVSWPTWRDDIASALRAEFDQ